MKPEYYNTDLLPPPARNKIKTRCLLAKYCSLGQNKDVLS